ncbi:MAG: hypothetical protein AAB156_00845 [Pseudomonadota bacterium]
MASKTRRPAPGGALCPASLDLDAQDDCMCLGLSPFRARPVLLLKKIQWAKVSRPDKLPPPDVVMFTGTQSLEEFRREHAVQYNRLVETGQLEKYLVDTPSRPMTLGSKVLGITLITVGLVLLILVAVGFFGG